MSGWHFFHHWDDVINEHHCEFCYGWKSVSTEQEDGHSDLSLQRCFVSIPQPVAVFVYFCPSSGVNKTPLCQRGVWVMRLVSLEAVHPTGHGSASEIQGKWIWSNRNLYGVIFLCVCVCFCTSMHYCRHHHECTKHFIKQNNKAIPHNVRKLISSSTACP